MSGPAPAYAKHAVGPAALAIVVLVLALAGCSKGSGSESGATMVTASSVASTTTGPVVPTSTTSTIPRSTEPPPTGNTRADFVTAIAQSVRYTVPAGAVTDAQVDCLAQSAVDIFGLEAFTSRGLTAAKVADPAFSFATLGMDLATANEVVDSYGRCGVDIRSFIQVALSAVVNPLQAECINSKIDEAVGRQILTELLAYGANSSEMQAKMRAVGRACGIKLD